MTVVCTLGRLRVPAATCWYNFYIFKLMYTSAVSWNKSYLQNADRVFVEKHKHKMPLASPRLRW